MGSKFMHGSSILLGDNTVPGVQLPKEMKDNVPIILQACRDWGLDFYPTVVQLLTYDEISEIAAYGGFPVRYPHWQFGMEYEELQRGYEFGMHKIYEMVINCCGLATKVCTSVGTKSASEVCVGDAVMGLGGWRNVVAIKRQRSSRVYGLKFTDFAGKTICTPNHKWLCIRNGKKVWVEAEDMIIGEVVLAGSKYEFNLNRPAELTWTPDRVLNETRSNVRNRLLSIKPPKGMTLDLAELMGVFSGDGSVGVRLADRCLAVPVHKPLEDYQRHVVRLMESVFGREPSVHIKKRSVNVVNLSSKFAVDYLDAQGFRKGSTYKTKRVPWSIWASSNEYRAAYLRGLFDTDGHCSTSLSMNCFNDYLAQDVQLLLLEMGIRSKVTRVKNDHNDIAVLRINGKNNVCKFAKYVNFSLKYKREALDILCQMDGRSGRSYPLPGLMRLVVERVKEVKEPPEWMYSYGRRTVEEVHSNSLFGFLSKAVDEGYEEEFGDLYEIASTPAYVLEEKTVEPDQETIDIALDHDDHDFLANGLISHNTNPCYQWLLSSNSLEDNLTVVAHATGHNDFFKNNIHFSATDTNMLNKMANHGTRIRRYMTRWGKERVVEFIDHVLRLETLIDGAEAWTQKMIRDRHLSDQRKYRHPRRLKVQKERMYMEPFINTRDFRQEENKRIAKADTADEIGLFTDPTKDILGFLRDNAPLKPWQQDIVAMLYEESLYFYPQRQTKVMNEGWASLTDHIIMARQGYIALGQKSHDMGIVEYAAHKMGVLGGKYSMNPYKLGFYLFLDIEERWNKGQFGTEWDECDDIRKKEKWDTGAMQGKEKIFEIRKYYDDLTFLNEFFTEDFCRAQEYFYWKHYPNGEYRLEHRDFKEIKTGLIRRHLNGGLPSIKLTEPNYRGKGYMMLQHDWDGRAIYDPYVRDVMTSLRFLWNNDIFLASKDDDGEEAIYGCYGTAEDDVELVSRKDHMKDW